MGLFFISAGRPLKEGSRGELGLFCAGRSFGLVGSGPPLARRLYTGVARLWRALFLLALFCRGRLGAFLGGLLPPGLLFVSTFCNTPSIFFITDPSLHRILNSLTLEKVTSILLTAEFLCGFHTKILQLAELRLLSLGIHSPWVDSPSMWPFP